MKTYLSAGDSTDFVGISESEEVGNDPIEKSRPRHHDNGSWGVVWSGKTCIVPETVIDKMQAYLSPKNVKDVQTSAGVWGLFPSWYIASIPYFT